MSSQRRRRPRPLQRPSGRTSRKVVRRTSNSDIKSGIMQSLIILLVIVNMVLIFFVIRQCSRTKTPVKEEKIEEKPRVIQLEVLNGCGEPGVAAKFTDYLRDRGFDVVKTANFEEETGRPNFNVIKTIVIDRRGNPESCLLIARTLGLNENRIIEEINEAYLIDATLVIGRDFSDLSCWKDVGM